MEAHLRQLLLDLRERLSEALAENPEVGETLDELRRSGYAVQLLMDCKREESDASEKAVTTPRALSAGDRDVAFRMNSEDFSFLRSVGIDPTRSTRGLRRKTVRQLPPATRPSNDASTTDDRSQD